MTAEDRKKILVVDDEPDIVEFQKAFLARHNYSVFTASNTKDALVLIEKESPDLLLCDVRLDDERAGLTILEKTKRIRPSTVVYLVTGLMDDHIIEKGYALGAKEILAKPVSNKVLEEKIKQALL